MKKYSFILVTIVLILLLSSCSLFACKHRKCTEQVVPPTCELDGYTEYTCKKCGDVSTGNIVEKLGHSYTEEVIAANCFEEGYTKHTCTVCSNTYNDNIVEKTKHYFVGEACPNCGMEEITENITPDTEWYDEKLLIFDLTTKEQLAGLASLVNSGIDFSGVNIYLDADINLEFYEWIPIGNSEYSFNGIFDGDGHTIFGLKINANYDYVGLFGNLSGKVCNVNIEQANVYVKRNYSYVSIVCGYLTGEANNITTDGFIEASKSNQVGSIAGVVSPLSIVYNKLSNKATINASNCVGGIFGYINSTGIVQIDNIVSTGNIKGVSQVGGIVGYANANVGSKIYQSSVCADIVGEYYIGGIAGKVENVSISTCTNDGSSIKANAYYNEGENFYVWLGGYVGYGYSIDNCINNVDIIYTSRGAYVGGIGGYLTDDISGCINNGDVKGVESVGGVVGCSTSNISNCSNKGNISGLSNNVGGIVGYITPENAVTLENLDNMGRVEGLSCVGGIIGKMYQVTTTIGDWYSDTKKGSNSSYKWYYHFYSIDTIIRNINNSADIFAINEMVGGNAGNISVESTYEQHNAKHTNHGGGYSSNACSIIGDIRILATNIVNTGNISAGNSVGEIFGSFVSDAPSTIDNYTVIGKVKVKSEVLEGEYDIGLNTNLTLTDRKIYGEENTNTETPETSGVSE